MTTPAPDASAPPPIFVGRRPLTRKERQRVDQLRRQADYLRLKQTERPRLPAGCPDQQWDARARALAAFEWAIEVLAETPENDRLREAMNALGPGTRSGRQPRDLGTDE